ncbi:hypothetical protein EZS27_004226 [termite gut metagenome]|uniref:Uncharacterized protein n=1 Tax=termite gut metagenome TaxID=433724 RepID=A0A5J4SQI1_9ZZZZ
MTDKWILQDIDKYMVEAKRIVVLDPLEQYGYLLPIIEQKYTVLKTDSMLHEKWQTVQEELFLRYDAESKHRNNKIVFYVTRSQSQMSFLFDYCFTHGCIDLSKPTEWLREKIFTHTGLQINMENPLLLIAAKLSIGKDINWWKKILQNLEELISIDDKLIPFLSNPENYFDKTDPDLRRLFEKKLFEMLGQPYMPKPAKTLATEVVYRLFEKLLYNDINAEWLNFYNKWLDSNTYADTLQNYIDDYKIDSQLNFWDVHPDHCFTIIDKIQLEQITRNFRDTSFVSKKIPKIKLRSKSRHASRFIPIWWTSVLTLLEFDSKPLTSCNSIEKIVDYYTTHFYKVDRAIRVIYETFIQDEAIVRPLQERYESLNHELLQHWFDCADSFKSNQQAYLPQVFAQAKPKTAVIVGDGVRYEMAVYVASELKKKFTIEQNVMLADMPSETEHNMSALYVGDNRVIAFHKDREKTLSKISGKDIVYIKLEALHYGIETDYLGLTYKDIDDVGEKLQLGALKLFSEFEKILIEKIQLLLNMGYREVHLVADHGFVLTGLLDEADKIEPVATGKKDVHERFIRTVDKQEQTEWLMFERPYDDYKYVYTAKNHRPFKSRGLYGFSHGGFTPQEIIIPKFIFRKNDNVTQSLYVGIINKKDLTDVTGELFAIKIQAADKIDNLFNAERKVQIILYSDNIKFNSGNIITIQTGNSKSIEFSFDGNREVTAVLIDATTQEQIDTVIIRKSNVRDLGGLL